VGRRAQQRRTDDPVEERDGAPSPAPTPAASILALQRSAGNAAVTQMLARAPTDAPLLPGITDLNKPLVPGLGANLGGVVELPMGVQMAVDQYLENQKFTYNQKVLEGTISVPEVVAEIRQRVPQAASTPGAALATAVRMHDFKINLRIPEDRVKVDSMGLAKQAEAAIANALPSVPTSVTLSGAAGSLKLSISGVQIKTKVGGATVKVDAGKDGAEAEVKKGDVSVGASAAWSGKEFAIKTDVKGAKLEGKVAKDDTKGWGWSASLVMPLLGDEIDVVPDLQKVVGEAHTAIAEVVAHIQGGGDPKDAYVTERLAKIKPAIDGAQRAAQKPKGPAVTLRANAGGDFGGGGFSAGVTLTVEF
jgi:hypothetical protein